MAEMLATFVMPSEISVDEDIRMRLIEPADCSRFFEMLKQGPEIRRYISWAADLNSEVAVEEAIQASHRKGESRYLIVDGHKTVSYAAVSPSKHPERTTEFDMGYFCSRENRGKGYVSRAMRSLMSEAARRLPVETFALYIEDPNAASRRVASKLGFYGTLEMWEDEILDCVERRYVKPATEVE